MTRKEALGLAYESLDDVMIYFPEQNLLLAWFRKIHNIHIEFRLIDSFYKWRIKFIKAEDLKIKGYSSSVWYNNYEDCVEHALIEALKLLK